MRGGTITPVHEHAVTATTHPRATLAATTLGSSLAFIDGSVVNVALPALAHDLGASPTTLPWAINAYLLPLGALILLGGSLGDHFGRRRLFLLGLVIFTAASVLCAAANGMPWLLAGRGLQGLGAALLMPNSLALLGSEFEGEARGRAIGTWAAVGALTAAAGPIAGGWLIDAIGWRSIFFINVPIAVGAGYLAWTYVADRRERRREGTLDSLGAGLITVSLGLLTWSLTEASGSRGSPGLIGSAAALGMLLFVAFLILEHRLAERAMMPLVVFAARSFIGLNLLTFFLYASMGGLVVLLPYFLIRMEHWTAVQAGAALLPLPILIGTGSRYMGRVAARYGGRGPLTIGSMVVAVGLALYARVGAGAVDYWTDILPGTVLVAVGMGACVAPLTTSVISAVDLEHVGIASGFNNAVARIAGLIATACLSFVWVRQDSLASFVVGFRLAALAGAASALLAAVCALTLIARES
jgi:EmrB/QacA subfamily drug resistance transporter